MTDRNEAVIREFRANGGKVASFATQPLLLLTHRGAKTGAERTNPLAYFPDGERYVIVASKGGAPSNPDWYHNLKASPRVTIEVGTDRFEAEAREAEGAERDRLWAMITERNGWFQRYAERTSRSIPVFVLERVDPTAG
ncbi:MAG TPA: nitroreductase/quinone reductase family protein [Actinomycetota bacterium]|nr:nitroreductase/quinone reductase family protein [Actinomycetota bacterium]